MPRCNWLTVWLVIWLGVAGPAWAGSSQVKSRDGSLVLEGADTHSSSADRKDSLHSLLSREVQVYIFRHNTRMWPSPQAYQARPFMPSAPRAARMPGAFLEGLIQKHAHQQGVDPQLVRAVMRHESGFNPWAVSPKGAQGLMQLMPGTAALMGVKNPFDPEENLAGGIGYLKFCLDRFQNNVPLAVAAYNAGPERVAKSGGVPNIPETQNFVSNVMGTYTGNPQPLPAPKAAPVKAAAPKGPAPLASRVLPTASRPAPNPATDDKVAPRSRAKVIEVRFPKGKRVVAAKPQGDD